MGQWSSFEGERHEGREHPEGQGPQRETVQPDTSMVMVVHKLTTMGIGALVVSLHGTRVDGIVNERDIVRGLNKHGTMLLEMHAKDVMSKGTPVARPTTPSGG